MIAAFHDDNPFYALSVARVAGRRVVLLEILSGEANAAVVASAPLSRGVDRGARRSLGLLGRPASQRVDGTLVDGVAGTVLSSTVAGGFVGTMREVRVLP